MKFVLFCHSFASCWNHGNAHFLRGIARELVREGHRVTVYEPADGWSRTNAIADGGVSALEEGARVVPGVDIRLYESLDLDRALNDADVVLVHEWNTPDLVAKLGAHRSRGGRFLLLFHDTHHRAITAPRDIGQFDLDGYDGVLAFGEVLRQVYLTRGWGRRVFTWHEAADSALFRRSPPVPKETDLIWIGNWGDDERSQELRQFLVEPVARLGIRALIHGVRYPAELRAELARNGLHYAGWLPNHRVPDAFAGAHVTIHVPRRPYVDALPGIPTIRVFEALACGIPLVCSPWNDAEALFPQGAFLTARSSDEMTDALRLILSDPDFAAELSRNGSRAILARHTCAHRVQELFRIIEDLTDVPAETASLEKTSG